MIDICSNVQYSDGIWVPEEGGPISTGACAESLVVVCQDRLLTILHLKVRMWLLFEGITFSHTSKPLCTPYAQLKGSS